MSPGSHQMSLEQAVDAFESLGVYPEIEQWRNNLRQWFSSVLMNPLVQKIKSSHIQVKQTTASIGTSVNVSQVGSDLPSTTSPASLSPLGGTKDWQPTVTVDEDDILNQLRGALLQSCNAPVEYNLDELALPDEEELALPDEDELALPDEDELPLPDEGAWRSWRLASLNKGGGRRSQSRGKRFSRRVSTRRRRVARLSLRRSSNRGARGEAGGGGRRARREPRRAGEAGGGAAAPAGSSGRWARETGRRRVVELPLRQAVEREVGEENKAEVPVELPLRLSERELGEENMARGGAAAPATSAWWSCRSEQGGEHGALGRSWIDRSIRH
ncbi:uncharacterized protein LOC124706915 [Lolium rigidum]|uniref:uncharacterized protein LOC124706915 n=1 Tax=Lolium rigidum TaxID=89674 RepID=UPI001F5D6B6A|nr:uncharacterized protein LOC124706915 [Lolium rigidum]